MEPALRQQLQREAPMPAARQAQRQAAGPAHNHQRASSPPQLQRSWSEVNELRVDPVPVREQEFYFSYSVRVNVGNGAGAAMLAR